jgi:hypothetical protein
MVRTLDMVRDANGTLTDVVERAQDGEGEFGGTMTDLLCPVETTPEIRHAAKDLIETFCTTHGFDLTAMQLDKETLQ